MVQETWNLYYLSTKVLFRVDIVIIVEIVSELDFIMLNYKHKLCNRTRTSDG